MALGSWVLLVPPLPWFWANATSFACSRGAAAAASPVVDASAAEKKKTREENASVGLGKECVSGCVGEPSKKANRQSGKRPPCCKTYSIFLVRSAGGRARGRTRECTQACRPPELERDTTGPGAKLRATLLALFSWAFEVAPRAKAAIACVSWPIFIPRSENLLLLMLAGQTRDGLEVGLRCSVVRCWLREASALSLLVSKICPQNLPLFLSS